ncbi:hypothetical protein DDE05_25730, partial [Streptomyces cavourensis]
LLELQSRHGFDAAVAGHAAHGNLHFLLAFDAARPEDVERYDAFMQEFCALVVDRFDGSLKAEHATGRNIAPFLEKEWGARATELMWRTKQVIDPGGVLAPRIVLDRDPRAHLRGLKTIPKVEAVADRLFRSAFRNCGQVCMAVKRVYAPARLHARVVEALAERAKTVVVGPGLDPGTELGPVNNAAQLARVERYTARALEEGARAVAGGHRLDRPGYFYAPTILTDVPPDSAVVMEEQFGPVLPVLPYGHLDEAVEAANATRYGLGGSVWGTDLDRAEEVAGRLECGTAWINHHAELSLDQPFAGIKESGVGVAGGPWGLYGNLRPFVVHRPREGGR